MSVAVIPIYLRLLGVEPYGLIGMSVALQAGVSLLDLGLGVAANREAAVLRAVDGWAEVGDLVRTLECLYWIGCAVIIIGISSSAHFIAGRWLQPKTLTPSEIVFAIVAMAFALGIQFPVSLYVGVLNGLQRQVHVNLLTSGMAVMKAVLGVSAVLFVSPTIHTLFASQAIAAVLQAICFRILLYKSVPSDSNMWTFKSRVLRRLGRFSGQMALASFVMLGVNQMDKIILSKRLTLGAFGVYSVAASLAGFLMTAVYPLSVAVLPRFCEVMAKGSKESLFTLYARSSQFAAALIAGGGSVAILFAEQLMMVVTKNPTLAQETAPILRLLFAGAVFSALLNMPVNLYLASGSGRLLLYQNVIWLAVCTPAMVFAVPRFGALGAAGVVASMNLLSLLAVVPITQARFFDGTLLGSYASIVLAPFVGAFIGTGLFHFVPLRMQSTPAAFTYLGFAAFIGVGSAILAGRLTRTTVQREIIERVGWHFG